MILIKFTAEKMRFLSAVPCNGQPFARDGKHAVQKLFTAVVWMELSVNGSYPLLSYGPQPVVHLQNNLEAIGGQ